MVNNTFEGGKRKESEKYEVENETKGGVSKLKKEVEKQDNIEKRKESEKHEVENETKGGVSKLKKEVEEKKDKMEKKEESKKKYIKLKKKYEEVLKKIGITLTKEDREKLIKNHDKKELKHFYNKMNDATNKNKTSKFLKKWKNKGFDELLAKISEKDKKKEKHKKNSDKKEKKKNSNTTTNNSTETKEEQSTTTNNSTESKEEQSTTTNNSTESKEEPSTITNNSTESKEEKNQEGLDKEKNTYTNSKSGLTYNLYDQAKRNNKDLAARGCMLTSAACISSAVDRSITPVDYYNKHRHSLVYNSIPKMTNNKIESKVLLPGEKTKWPKEKTQQAIEEMIKNLEKGYPVEFMVHGPRHGGNNTLTTGQHYMAAVDIRENGGNKEVFIANTHNGKGGGRYPVDKAFASLRQASIYTPAQA